jgi:hypothetical protein
MMSTDCSTPGACTTLRQHRCMTTLPCGRAEATGFADAMTWAASACLRLLATTDCAFTGRLPLESATKSSKAAIAAAPLRDTCFVIAVSVSVNRKRPHAAISHPLHAAVTWRAVYTWEMSQLLQGR